MEQLLRELLGQHVSLVESKIVGGGCIAESHRVRVRDESGEQTDWFLKSQPASELEALFCEAHGLRLLADSQQILTPAPLGPVSDDRVAVLALPWLSATTKSPEFYRTFGQQLARHHKATEGHRIGLDHNNFLGRSKQTNLFHQNNWIQFVVDCRLDPQIRCARDNGVADPHLCHKVNQILNRLPDLLSGRQDATCLLHGDLWNGNYMAVKETPGVAWIDPAVSWGCREMEFGMLRLFGSCPDPFYAAYQKEYQMPDGWEDRVDVYVLYHLLNHLNLFGGGYLSSCTEVAERILRR